MPILMPKFADRGSEAPNMRVRFPRRIKVKLKTASFSELEFFVLLTWLGSLSAAARGLDITPAAASMRLAGMEKRMGVQFVEPQHAQNQPDDRRGDLSPARDPIDRRVARNGRDRFRRLPEPDCHHA